MECSWVVNTALLLTSEGGGTEYTADEKREMRKILDENYAYKEAGVEAKVKEVYERKIAEVTVMVYVHPHPTSLTSAKTPFAKDIKVFEIETFLCLFVVFLYSPSADVSLSLLIG